MLLGIASAWVQDLVELHEISMASFLRPGKVPLDAFQLSGF